MADLLDFVPVFQEDAATVRARLDADANAGIDIADPMWVDTREGTFYWDITQVILLELVRIWDALSFEVPASAFVVFAWGTYLDAHAATYDLERKGAVEASGELTLIGDPGATISAGLVVSAEAASDTDESPEFRTIAEVTLGAGLSSPAGLTATPTTGGTLPDGTYLYSVTALNAFGETNASPTVSVDVTDGTADLDWSDVTGATGGYNVYRDGFFVANSGTSAYTDTGAAAPSTVIAPDENTTAGATVGIVALEPGAAGKVAAGSITSIESPVDALDSVTNAAPTQGGVDVESDAALRERIMLEFAGRGMGNINDYRRSALALAGVGRVTVIPVWNGPGTVKVVLMDEDGGPVSSVVTDAATAFFDPVTGDAEGAAPPGVEVTISTPTQVPIDVVATVTFKPGYSLTGATGGSAQEASILKALAAYIGSLDVGEDVIYEHVKAQFFRAEGVYTISGVTVEGGTSDVVITTDQIASLGTVTLS
jgi:uncharacterized phage protein gp47/JayE